MSTLASAAGGLSGFLGGDDDAQPSRERSVSIAVRCRPLRPGESAESACTPEDSASTTCSMTSSDTCSKASERITDPALAATAQMPTKGAARVGWRRGRRRWGGADAD